MSRTSYARYRRVGSAAVLGVAVLAGAFGAPSASGGQRTAGAVERAKVETADLLYHCETESGERDLLVRVGMSLPEAGVAGKPLQPTDVAVRMAFDEAIVTEFADRGATAVTGAVRLTVLARQAGERETTVEPQRLHLRELAVDPTPLPPSGQLRLEGTGPAPQLTPRAAGDMTFSAERLTLVLRLQSPEPVPGDGPQGDAEGDTGNGKESNTEPSTEGGADGDGEGGGGAGPAAADDTAGGASSLSAFDCLPAPDQNTRIGALAVDGDRAAIPTDDPDARSGDGDALPEGGNRRTPLDGTGQRAEMPEDCEDFGKERNAWCSYIGGYTNIDGLNGSARIDPGIVNLAIPNMGPCNDGSEWFWFCQTATAELRHNGKHQLPPTRNSFHAFDFMPSEATVELTQAGPMRIEVRAQINAPPYDGSVVAHTKLSVRVYDVTVNGVPLDVGADCRTAEPISVSLTADYPGAYTPVTGGFLDGYTDIPPFSGCGVGEDLDPLMTGLISGEDSYVKMTQGAVCDIRNVTGCPPPIPELQR